MSEIIKTSSLLFFFFLWKTPKIYKISGTAGAVKYRVLYNPQIRALNLVVLYFFKIGLFFDLRFFFASRLVANKKKTNEEQTYFE